jgi:hypothetical protein
METRSIYLTVRVDIECPDEYNSSDLELATDLCLDGISLEEEHECKVTDFEICGLNE